MIFQGQNTAIGVRVQHGRGLPVEGVRVAFQVDAPRTRYASIQPVRADTQGGRVRAIVWSDLVDRVRITVRVGTLIIRTILTVVRPLAHGERPRDASRSRPEATDLLPGFNGLGEVRI